MKSNNNGGILLAGLAVFGYMVISKKEKEVHGLLEGISGTVSRKKVITNYLIALGLPEGQKQLQARWAKMSTEEIILDAFRNGILIVDEDAVLRNLLYQKFNFNLGLEKQDNAYTQNIKRWRKLKLKQIITEAERYGIRLLDGTIYKDKSGKRNFPQMDVNVYS